MVEREPVRAHGYVIRTTFVGRQGSHRERIAKDIKDSVKQYRSELHLVIDDLMDAAPAATPKRIGREATVSILDADKENDASYVR